MTDTTDTTADAIPDHLVAHFTSRIGHNSADLIEGETGSWEIVIGMEVHAQVTSESKLFSGAPTDFGGEPNTHVSPCRRGHARHAAGPQRGRDPAGRAHRAGSRSPDQSAFGV